MTASKQKEQIVVRGATPADEPELLRLLRLMWAEGGMFPLDEDCVRDIFARAFNKDGGLIGVIGEIGNLRAALYLLITRQWYTTHFHIEDIFNFVDPAHRSSSYADALIRFAQHSADSLGIPLFLGVLSNKRTLEKVRLYRRRLGMPVGAVFVHNCTFVNEHATDTDLWKPHASGNYRRHVRKRKDDDIPQSAMLPMLATAIATSALQVATNGA